jgi:heme/copper-type cytochrome/quinol oxidase subunit 1
MKLNIHRPHRLFWLSIPAILLLSIVGTNNTLDLQLHDTYFVVSAMHLGLLLSALLGFMGLLYWLFRNRCLVNWMTAAHVISTILGFVLLSGTGLIYNGRAASEYRTVNQLLFIVILAVLLSQLIFMVNLVIGIVRK